MDMTHKHITVQIPKELSDIIDKLVEQRYKGYRTRAEFVTDAVRRRLEVIKELNGIPKKI